MQWSYSYRISPPNDNRVHMPSVGNLTMRFMNAVMFWNHAESTLRQIVQHILGQSLMSLAVAAEMGNMHLQRAARTAAHEPEMAHVAEHLNHFCDGFDRLREYRNFYVHGVYATTVHEGFTAFQMLTIDGKNQVRMFNPIVTAIDLTAYVEAVQRLIGYGAAILKEMGADGTGLDNMIKAYSSKLEKPEWPPQLKKVPQYLQARTPAADPDDDA